MARTMVQFSVKDYASWRKSYDSLAGLRSERGAVADQVFQDAVDKNKVTVMVDWKSLEIAKAWAESSELRAAQEKGGVLGKPDISILQEAGR